MVNHLFSFDKREGAVILEIIPLPYTEKSDMLEIMR
jgi:hypothetical protein